MPRHHTLDFSDKPKKYSLTAFAYDKKGNLLSVGENSYVKTHTFMSRCAKRAGEPHKIFLHAEVNALLKSRHKGKVYKLVVTRYDAEGNPRNAKPCKCCQVAIRDFDVKIVEHT